MNAEQARVCVRDALLQVVPDADVGQLGPDEPLRDAFELDSLDFLSFVEQLSAATQVRIDEDDYSHLTSYEGCVSFLQQASSAATTG